MNIIFTFIFIISTILMLFTNPTNILNVILNGAEKAVNLSFSLIGIYAFWLGILEVCEVTGINKKIAKILSPIINKLFNNPNEETKKQIAINLSSNMLGMGNAATPSGIKAMQGLDDKSGKINKAMTILMLLNTSSIQLIPTTIIGLRIANSSTNASSIILPTIFASFISVFVAIGLVILIEKIKLRKGKK